MDENSGELPKIDHEQKINNEVVHQVENITGFSAAKEEVILEKPNKLSDIDPSAIETFPKRDPAMQLVEAVLSKAEFAINELVEGKVEGRTLERLSAYDYLRVIQQIRKSLPSSVAQGYVQTLAIPEKELMNIILEQVGLAPVEKLTEIPPVRSFSPKIKVSASEISEVREYPKNRTSINGVGATLRVIESRAHNKAAPVSRYFLDLSLPIPPKEPPPTVTT